MSTNCIQCVRNERTGFDLLCDDCRVAAAQRVEPVEISSTDWLECAAYHEQVAREARQHEEQWKGYGRKSPHKVEEYTRHERWASMLRQHSNEKLNHRDEKEK